MARKVVWAYAAEEDLEAAAAYIHKDSPAYAASFVDKSLEVGRSLNEFAERGRRCKSNGKMVSLFFRPPLKIFPPSAGTIEEGETRK